MIGKQKVLLAVLLVYALLISGCDSVKKLNVFNSKPKANQEIGKTPGEVEKTKLYERIEKKYKDAEAHYELGKLYQRDGLWAKAEHEYNLACNFDAVHRLAQAGRIKVLGLMGDKSKAEVLADIYINRAEYSAMSSLRMALAFQEHELDEYALRCYQQALRLAPTSAKINKQIGFYYLSKGEEVQARTYLMQSFQLDSNQPDVSGVLGRLGVPVTIPRNVQKNTKNLDRAIDKNTEEMLKDGQN